MKLFGRSLLKVGASIVGFGIALFVLNTGVVHASAGDNMVGYAWSSNIGWIDMNNCDATKVCTPPDYGVTIAPTGATRDITGYAWSSNLGWISFNGAASDDQAPQNCPTKTARGNCQAYGNLNGDGSISLKGWARVCSVFVSGCTGKLKDDSIRGGFDGFISLGGASYGIKIATTGLMSGMAWGSEVLGWIDFSQVKVVTAGAPAVTLTASPNPVAASGNTTVLTWTVTWPFADPANICTASGAWSGTKANTGGTQTSGGITGPTTFDITCTGPSGSDTAEAIVTVAAGPKPQCSDGIDNDGDGLIDFPGDPGCSSASDNDETNAVPKPQCSDGIDNDGDSVIDASDPGCITNGVYNPNDNDETDAVADICTNIPAGTEASLISSGTLTFPPYRKVSDGAGGNKCLCVAGYVLNTQFKCVKPSYQEL